MGGCADTILQKNKIMQLQAVTPIWGTMCVKTEEAEQGGRRATAPPQKN